MSLVAKSSGGTFTPVPAGTYLARCYRIVDLGTQKSEWQGQVKHLPKIMVQFEVHGEDENDKPLVTSKGEPMTISKNYTLSLGEKASLRKDLASWRGRDFTQDELAGFELKNVLGAWAMISVTHSAVGEKTYANIASVSMVPKAMKQNLPEPHNKAAMFVISDPDMELFESFSDMLRQKIASSPEWESRSKKPTSSKADPFEDMGDDIPFN
jgi:hypothetical protein